MICLMNDEITDYGEYAYVEIPFEYDYLFGESIVKVKIINIDSNNEITIDMSKYPNLKIFGSCIIYPTFEKAKNAKMDKLHNYIKSWENDIDRAKTSLARLEKEIE